MKLLSGIVLAFFIAYFLEGLSLLYKYRSPELWLVFYVLCTIFLVIFLEPNNNE
jgi:predicted PurR-regulated permease PerM